MTDKSNDTPKAEGSAAAGQGASAAGRPVTSPFDSPTTQMRKPDPKDIPRTDEDLGLDPDEVPGASTAPTGRGGDDYGYATIPPASAASADTVRLQRRNREARRGTLDLGLFVLRLVVGYTFIYHGLQKLTGWFHGPGLDGTKTMMESGGWDYPSLSTALVIAGELGGGILLVIGLATPLAAGAVLATILNAWMWKQGMVPGFQYNAGTPTGVELDSILAGAALAIILTGPGRWSFDRTRGWATRPSYGSFGVVVLAIAAAVLTFWFLHGGNPLEGVGPF
ncbi:DoxX family protein [Nocardia sp. NPDC060249]|uniref:DoxX family protein n=1 Tax=Nocardia sp. NPDC060249 TaxID=3347082 RepID=UPI00366414EE